MGDRAVYCARLESVCAERHPGFESPPIRQLLAAFEVVAGEGLLALAHFQNLTVR